MLIVEVRQMLGYEKKRQTLLNMRQAVVNEIWDSMNVLKLAKKAAKLWHWRKKIYF